MAKNAFLGTAGLTAEVTTLTPGGTITTGDVNTITFKDEAGNTIATVSFTVAGTTTAAAVVTGLAAAIAANAYANATVSVSGTGTLILTAKTAGTAFYVTPSVTGVGTLTGTNGNTTPNSSPTDWNTAANWLTGAVPASGDYVTIDYNNQSIAGIQQGLNQSAVTLAQLIVWASNKANIANVAYFLKIGATIAQINAQPSTPTPVGNNSIFIDFGTTQTYATVYNGPATAGQGAPPIQIRGNNTSSILDVQGGYVGYCDASVSDTGTFAAVNVSSGATLMAGAGTSIASLNNNGGAAETSGSVGTVTTFGGATYLTGAIEATTVVANGGTTYSLNRPASGAAIGTLTISNNATVDFSEASGTATVTTTNGSGGKIIEAYGGQITFTNGIAPTMGSKRTISFQVA